MNNNFKKMLHEAGGQQTMNATLDLAERLTKMLRKGGVIDGIAGKADPGLKKDLAKLRGEAESLAAGLEDLIMEIQQASR